MPIRIQSAAEVDEARDSGGRINETGRLQIQSFDFQACVQGSGGAVLRVQRSCLACEFDRAVAGSPSSKFKWELRRIREIRGFDVDPVVCVRAGVGAGLTDDHGPVL